MLRTEVGRLAGAATDSSYCVQVRVFHAATPGELADQVNGFLADVPAAFVRAVWFQTVAVAVLRDEEPRWEYAVLVEYEIAVPAIATASGV